MNFNKLVGAVTAASIAIASVGQSIACTSLLTFDTNGNAYHGRTQEYSQKVPTSVTYFPAGTRVESTTPDGKQGKSFNTQYGMISIEYAAIANAKMPVIFEGMNDQGLAFSGNEFNNSSTPPVGNDPSKILSGGDFGSWILGTFKTTGEVKAALLSGDTQFWLPAVPIMGGLRIPFHYAIYDRKGGSIVVEMTDNKVNVYDNPVYALTNAPAFPWHLENLNNYTFTNVDKNTGQLGKLKLVTPDAGIALTGLPSTETSQGRFVKAAFYANYVRKASNPDDAITTLAHIMNNFDRPYDLTVDGAGGVGDGPRSNKTSSEVTYYTVLNDLSRNLFYIRTIDAMNWSVIDLNKLKAANKVKTTITFNVGKPGADEFSQYYK